MTFGSDDEATREAVIVGLAWRDLRRARWLGVFGAVVLDGGASLEASEVDALDQIVWTESGRMHEIAEGLQIDASTATRAVDRLERRGLVERARDPENGRFVQVTLTDEGRRVHGELLERRLEFVSNVLDQFSDGDREVLVRLLPVLADAVTASLRSEAAASNLARAEAQEAFGPRIERCAHIDLDGPLLRRRRMTLRYQAVPISSTPR